MPYNPERQNKMPNADTSANSTGRPKVPQSDALLQRMRAEMAKKGVKIPKGLRRSDVVYDKGIEGADEALIRIDKYLEPERKGRDLLERMKAPKGRDLSKGGSREAFETTDEDDTESALGRIHKALSLDENLDEDTDKGKERIFGEALKESNLMGQRQRGRYREKKSSESNAAADAAIAELEALREARVQSGAHFAMKAQRGRTEKNRASNQAADEAIAELEATRQARQELKAAYDRRNSSKEDGEPVTLRMEDRAPKEDEFLSDLDVLDDNESELEALQRRAPSLKEQRGRQEKQKPRDSLTEAEGTFISKSYVLQQEAEDLLERYRLHLQVQEPEDEMKKAKQIDSRGVDYPAELSNMKKRLDALEGQARQLDKGKKIGDIINVSKRLREEIIEALNASRARSRIQETRQSIHGPAIKKEQTLKLRKAYNDLNHLENLIKQDTGKNPNSAWNNSSWFRLKNRLARLVGSSGIYDEWREAKEEVERLEDEKLIAEAENRNFLQRERQKTGRTDRVVLNLPPEKPKLPKTKAELNDDYDNLVEARAKKAKYEEEDRQERVSNATRGWEESRPLMTVEYAQTLVPEAHEMWNFIAEKAKERPPQAFRAGDGPTAYIFALARYREALDAGYPKAAKKAQIELDKLNERLGIENNAYIQAAIAKKTWSGKRDDFREKRLGQVSADKTRRSGHSTIKTGL